MCIILGYKYSLNCMATCSCWISGRKLTTYAEQIWFHVAVLPGQSTFELSITSGKFDADIFSMANATEYVENATYAMPTSERHEIASNKITLNETPIEGSVAIRGMTEVDAAPTEAGTFQVDGKDVKFSSGEEGTIEVIYDYEKSVYEAIIDNKSSAIGEASCIWPVKNIRGFAA